MSPRGLRRLWYAFAALLAASVAAELAVDWHAEFAMERWFAAYAIYGFAACAVLILAAKALGALLKRPEGYYDE